MLGTDEKNRLLSRFDGDPPSPLAALLKCAGGILALVMVAAGPWLVLTAGSPNSYDQAAERDVPPAGTVVPASVAESKRVFDERRQHHEAARKINVQAVSSAAASSQAEPE